MSKNIKIILVEDNENYRNVIIRALQFDPDMELVSQFGTAEIALRSLQERSKSDEPDVILLDLNLPGMSGLEALPWFEKYAPTARIIILTQSNKEADVLSAISQGAAGYLLKSARAKQIMEGIHTVMSGGASLDPAVASFILKTMRKKLVVSALENTLSPREQEIITLLAKGLEKKEIGEQLHISSNTVSYHVKNIYEKLDVPNARAAIGKAYSTGILPRDDTSAE